MSDLEQFRQQTREKLNQSALTNAGIKLRGLYDI